jgi:hypothetical protein
VKDLHLRILRQVARRRQRDLDDHDAVDHRGATAAAERGRELARGAAQARARFSAAQTRRHLTPPRETPDQTGAQERP